MTGLSNNSGRRDETVPGKETGVEEIRTGAPRLPSTL